MEDGGNAVDGAIAANAVLGVVLPTTCGIGGDLFALIQVPGSPAPAALNASGRGGSGLDADALRSAGHAEVPLYGPESVTVPGCVDGWLALVNRFGTRPLGALLEPAVRIARDGFEVSVELAAGLRRLRPRISGMPSAGPLYPGGAAPAAGSTLTRPALATTLETIGRTGRSAFYEGRVATEIATATGGVLTTGDLAAGRADWVDPIGAPVFGLHAWTMPPNSQGYLTPASAHLFEQLGPPADPADPAFVHAAVECYRAVAWEREDLVADEDHLPLPADRLLDPERLAPRLDVLRTGRAGGWPSPTPGDGGTAYLCTCDTAGTSVSLIQSNFHGIGSGISAGDTGVWLHNRGAGFNLVPGHPNEAAPGKRPLHTLSPTLWTSGGRIRLLLGTRGGHQQPQYLLQAAALLLHAGLEPAATQAVPRWSMDHAAAGVTPVVAVERSTPEETVAGLQARGHSVETVDDWQAGWGPVSICLVEEDGTRRAAADPRVTTASAAAG
jgi:gamma-glutamyltranspeptidase/glutathione hydrolase